jgi:hypothetical protein
MNLTYVISAYFNAYRRQHRLEIRNFLVLKSSSLTVEAKLYKEPLFAPV